MSMHNVDVQPFGNKRSGGTFEPRGLPAPPDHGDILAEDHRSSTLDGQLWTARGTADDSLKPPEQAYPLKNSRA